MLDARVAARAASILTGKPGRLTAMRRAGAVTLLGFGFWLMFAAGRDLTG
jgi:hypothetical protein